MRGMQASGAAKETMCATHMPTFFMLRVIRQANVQQNGRTYSSTHDLPLWEPLTAVFRRAVNRMMQPTVTERRVC